MHSKIAERMLGASEIFFYSQKFREKLFILVLNSVADFRELLQDIQVISDSHIYLGLLVADPTGLAEELGSHNSFDDLFQPAELEPGLPDKILIKKQLRKDQIPVFYGQTALSTTKTISEAFALARNLRAEKVIISGLLPVIKSGDRKIHKIAPAELLEIVPDISAETNAVARLAKDSGIDTVVIESLSGALFQEIFTHLGSGTLITTHSSEEYRPATTADINEIYFLLLPYIQNGLILPTSRQEILKNLDSYYVYTIDNLVVASAKTTDYGEAFEIGKLCALPRYRGSGITESLVRHVLDLHKSKQRYAFALTINPAAAELFLALGFKEVDRSGLPEAWRSGYDLSRPSKAYQYTY